MYVTRGFGASTTADIAAIGGGAANIANIAQSNMPTGTKIMSSVGAGLMAAAPMTGPGAPFVLAAGAIMEFLSAVGVGAGCGKTCIQASEYADQAEQLLQQNIDGYMALPVPRSVSDQQAALLGFDQIWAALKKACATVPGAAGADCVSGRQAGACTWKQPASSVPSWGTPKAGECWNWFSGYRDPIANDPHVSSATPAVLAPLIASLGGSSGVDGSSWLLLAAVAALVALIVFS